MGRLEARRSAVTPWVRRGVVVAVLLVVLSPLVTNAEGFPVSNYPMYGDRRGREVVLPTAVGIDGAGRQRRLSLATIAATDDPLIATARVAQAIATGTAARLCTDIAPRVGDDVVAIEIVEELHDVVARTVREDSLRERTVHARCPVAP